MSMPSRLVEDALRRLRTLLRFHECYVADVRRELEDLATREIASALVNDAHLRKVFGDANLVAKIEALEAELETARAEADEFRPVRHAVLRPEPAAPPAPRPAPVPLPCGTTCKKGHALTTANSWRLHNGGVRCKQCQRDCFLGRRPQHGPIAEARP